MGELDWLRSLVEEERPSAHQVVRMRHRLSRHIRSGDRRHRLRRAAFTLGAVAVIVIAVAITSTVRSDPAETIRNVAKVAATIPNEDGNAHE
jgi:hypothetical protein